MFWVFERRGVKAAKKHWSRFKLYYHDVEKKSSGSSLIPFLFTTVMDRLTDEAQRMRMFADDTVICTENREQVEENLERWRSVIARQNTCL